MKLLTVIQRFYPVIGGSEILTKTYLDYLSTNHDVTVYTTKAEDIQSFWNSKAKKIQENPNYDYQIKRYNFLIPTQIKNDSKLNKFPIASNYPGPFSPQIWRDLVINKNDFDLYFLTAFPYDHLIPAYVSAKKWKKPIISMPLIHQEYPELFLTSLRLSILDNSDRIVSLSNSEKNILIEHGIESEKISVIPPTIISPVEKLEKSNHLKQNELQNYNGKTILFVGTKSIMKGVIFLLQAMMQIWKKRENVRLILIGPSSPEFEIFFKQIPSKFKEKILNLGIVSEEEKLSAFSLCDVFVLPSKSESFGLVYVEAWLNSKPVIGCKIKSMEEVIDDKKNGILTEFGNVPELEQSISFLLDNPEVCQQFGINGKIKSSKFTSIENLKKFEDLCSQTIQDFNNLQK